MTSFDLWFLGLRDPSPAGRTRFVGTLSRLAGIGAAEAETRLTAAGEPLFSRLSAERAREVVEALAAAGARVEIRPRKEPAVRESESAATRTCPRCDFAVPADAVDCPRCGLVFAKWEREQVLAMQREQRLEEALAKAMEVRQKWDGQARELLAKHPLKGPLPPELESVLTPQEIPFLMLHSEEGPILLTSRRLLASRSGVRLSIPWELMSDVAFSSGALKKRSDRTKMQITLAGPIPVGPESTAAKLVWSVGRISYVERDAVTNWVFARKFACGSCGATDLQFRLDGRSVHGRCMHCATDHEIDLDEAVAIPLLTD